MNIDYYNNKFSEGVNSILDDILNPQIKVVSFDVFDTLLFRPVSTPADTFRLLENKLKIPNFHNMRVAAEQEARKKQDPGLEDITYEDIYSAFQKMFGYGEDEIKIIKEEEKKLEYQFLYERKTAKFLYNCACMSGKRIIIISDMYFNSEFIDSCLKKNGYNRHSKVYVSSETGMTKTSKKMFNYVLYILAKDGIKPDEVVHIGDNKKSDVDCALGCGMRARHLPKPADIRNSCIHLKKLYGYVLSDVMNSNNAMLYGFLANLYFDDPFVDYDKKSFFNGDPSLMGYWFAPLMMGFTLWLNKKIEENKVEQFIYVWRDGYLPSKLIEIVRPYLADRKVEFKKLYMGRTLRMPYMANEKNGLFNSFFDYPLREEYTVDYFIKNRLLCNDEKQKNDILKIFYRHGYIDEREAIGNVQKYRGFLHELEPYFIENAKKKTELTSEYISQVVKKGKKTAVFDRSPRGKSSRFLKQYFGINSVCYTTEVYDVPTAKLKDINLEIESYLEYGMYYINKMGRIWAMLFERIISDTAPGYAYVEKSKEGQITVVLDDEPTEQEVILANALIADVQNSIIRYIEELSNILGDYLRDFVIDRQGVFDYTIEFLSTPGECDALLVTQISPDKSSLAPIDENTFSNWYEKKFDNSYKNKKSESRALLPANVKQTRWDRIRNTGYMITEKWGIRIPVQSLYHFITRKSIPEDYRVRQVESDVDNYIMRLTQGFNDIDVLIIGSVPREMARFINSLSREDENKKYLFVAAGFMKMPDFFSFPCLEAPKVFSFWGIDWQKEIIRVPERMKKLVEHKSYLRDLVEKRVLSGYSKSVAILIAYEAERYYEALIRELSPKCLLVWNNWGKNSVVPSVLAREKGINVVSMERGFLEGTVMLSRYGYGDDLINREVETFCHLEVTDEECCFAQKIIDYQRKSGLNRYTQPTSNGIDKLKEKLIPENPIVLLLGAFDLENPGFPMNDETKKKYSPIFRTSKDAMLYIAKIACKNKWNFIYKEHPLMNAIDRTRNKKDLPKNVHIISDININELIDVADVVLCMVSGLTYVSIVRGKPLVELAYTPLRGKGCSYQAHCLKDVEAKIKEALDMGLSQGQKKAFIKHVAQVNKYYYYDDLCARPVRYGKSIIDAMKIIEGVDRYEDCSLGTYKIK